MFHQLSLCLEDRLLLCFFWRDLKTEEPPSITCQDLCLGSTCSPCYGAFALQKHLFNHSPRGADIRVSIEVSLYVDNCLESFPSVDKVRQPVKKHIPNMYWLKGDYVSGSGILLRSSANQLTKGNPV